MTFKTLSDLVVKLLGVNKTHIIDDELENRCSKQQALMRRTMELATRNKIYVESLLSRESSNFLDTNVVSKISFFIL